MATRTVRLDDETEDALREIRAATGLPISEALKRGIRSLRAELSAQARRDPFAVYRTLDLGPGGYARTRAADSRAGVREALRKKHRR